MTLKAKLFRKNLLAALLIVVGVSLITVSGLALYDYYRVTHEGVEYPASEILSSDVEISEKPTVVDAAGGYSVPANQPRAIELSSLDITGYVQPLGLTKDAAMATPSNISFAGWYVHSPAPGDKGVSIINGHAGGRYTDGVFRHINQQKPGDTVRVQMGDLSWRNFEVVSSTVYTLEDSSGALFKDDLSIDRELHLITCDGDFDDASQTYSKRAIVVAKYVH